ncbi:MAG: hypothetical protein Q9165_005152 [Trypethelium subeluteriae]
MPRTGFRSSPALQIEIEDKRPIYFPGDTINGFVLSHRKLSALLDSLQSIRLKLFGRAKTKYVVKSGGSGHHRSIYRGRAVFVQVSKVVHQGHICETGQHAWPFSMTIPEHPTPSIASRGNAFDPSPPFLFTRDPWTKQETDVVQHQLPSVMYYDDESAWSRKKIQAFVEYALLAEVGSTKAVVPLYVRQRSVPSPIASHAMQLRSFLQETKTLALLPEYAGVSPPFGAKLVSMLRPSKTPKYSYSIMVAYPTIIQLEHPEPLPFKIYLIPNLDSKETTISPEGGNVDQLPVVTITSMAVELKSHIHIRCPGTFSDHGDSKHHTYRISGRSISTPVAVPIIQKSDSKPDQSQETANLFSFNPYTTSKQKAIIPSAALDLGILFSVFLGARSAKRQIYPSFATYNIAVSHTLKWKVNFSCAGEKHSVGGEPGVTVLAPSEEQEQMKMKKLGRYRGMEKSYDELKAGREAAVDFVGQIVQAAAS